MTPAPAPDGTHHQHQPQISQRKEGTTVLNTDPIKATPAVPCILAGQATRPRIKAAAKTVNVAIGRSTGLKTPCEYWAATDTDHDYGYGYEAIYDPKQISLADAEQWVRTQLDQQGVNVGRFLNEDEPDADTRSTALAAALYIAQYGYKLATAHPNPAARLDDMCDAVAELWDEITPRLPKKFAGAGLEFAETMRAAVADRLWAFTVVEQARADAASDSFGYVFDVLADGLSNGADPKAVRTTVPDVLRRVRAAQAQAEQA